MDQKTNACFRLLIERNETRALKGLKTSCGLSPNPWPGCSHLP